MNQKQRDFLIEAVNTQYKVQRDELNGRKPKAPSLNNYLIAAILDGSFVMKAATEVRATIRERVRDLGKGDTLLESRSNRWRDRDDEEDHITLPALVLFDEPPDYAAAAKKYRVELAKWEAEEKALEAAHNAMKLKIQVGSDAALQSLINQADKLCELSLTASNKLLLLT